MYGHVPEDWQLLSSHVWQFLFSLSTLLFERKSIDCSIYTKKFGWRTLYCWLLYSSSHSISGCLKTQKLTVSDWEQSPFYQQFSTQLFRFFIRLLLSQVVSRWLPKTWVSALYGKHYKPYWTFVWFAIRLKRKTCNIGHIHCKRHQGWALDGRCVSIIWLMVLLRGRVMGFSVWFGKKGDNWLIFSLGLVVLIWDLEFGDSERFLGWKELPTLTTSILALYGFSRLWERSEKGRKPSTGVCEVLSGKRQSCMRAVDCLALLRYGEGQVLWAVSLTFILCTWSMECFAHFLCWNKLFSSILLKVKIAFTSTTGWWTQHLLGKQWPIIGRKKKWLCF